MKFWVRWFILWLLLGAGLRCLFLYWYPAAAQMPGWQGFVVGMVNDVQAFVMLAGIVALFGLAGPRALRAAACVAVAVSLVVGFAEIFFWFEFESRLDRLVFHYLSYPKEVLFFLEEQLYLSLFALPFLALVWGLMRIISWPHVDAGAGFVHAGLIAAGAASMWLAQPLGQSNFRIVSEFASNGYLSVASAARYAVDDLAWLAQAPRPAGEPREFVMLPVSAQGTHVAPMLRAELGGKRHVILIIEESFAGPVWEDAQLRARYLPHTSKLADSSVIFSNMYATGSRTTRGMEALLNGFPPLPGIAVTERDGYERLPSLARAMAEGGYHPVFLYGGWPGFSNFSAYWRASGFREIWTREDFDEEFETSWGVADGALLTRLVEEMSALSRAHDRVFLATLTVSHHRPYVFPAGAVAFDPSARLSEHAMAYADQALGDFFNAARRQPWFADTLFVVAADHGLQPRGDALIPVNSYRIPLLLYAQGLQPRRFDGLASSMSLPKTLVSLLGIRTSEAFGGADLLCDCDTVVPVEFGYHIGLLERDALHVVRADGGYANWSYDLPGNRLGPVNDVVDPAARRRVIDTFAPAYQWFHAR